MKGNSIKLARFIRQLFRIIGGGCRRVANLMRIELINEQLTHPSVVIHLKGIKCPITDANINPILSYEHSRGEMNM